MIWVRLHVANTYKLYVLVNIAALQILVSRYLRVKATSMRRKGAAKGTKILVIFLAYSNLVFEKRIGEYIYIHVRLK